jgi:short-subunit dehydrogenase
MSYDHAMYFGELSKEKIQQLININVFGTVYMTHLVLSGMETRYKEFETKKRVTFSSSSSSSSSFSSSKLNPSFEQRKRGAIINISSASSTLREPFYAVYSGTKVGYSLVTLLSLSLSLSLF